MQFGLIEAIRHWGTYRPDKVALYSNGRSFTYGCLLGKSEAAAKAILDTTDGHRIAVATQQKAAFVMSLLGVMRAGKSAVILNTRLADKRLQVTIDDTTPDAIVQDLALGNSLASTALAAVPRVILDSVNKSSSPNVPWPEYEASEEWGIVFSSGSTGVPKGIERDHDSMVTEVIGWSLELPLTRHSVFYIGRPLFYTGGLVLTLASLFVGATVIANDYRDDENSDEVWSDYIRESGRHVVEWAFFVPDQLRAFLAAQHRSSTPGKYILVMGAPISGETKLAARDRLGSDIVESWGNSESLGTITEPQDLDERPDSVGRPFLTDELFVVDDELRICAKGEIGRLAGAHTAGFRKYTNRPEETKIVKRESLILSDDIGYMDQDGFFYVKGRVQDRVVRGHTSVFLPDIAENLRARSEVQEADVCAVDNDNEIDLVAAVVLKQRSTATPADYCKTLNADLPSDEQLSRVAILAALPRLPSGKIDRLELHRQVSVARSSQ